MKLSRTKEYNFGWLVLFPLLDVAFLLVFFLLLSSNFILQPGISVSMPFSRFTLGPHTFEFLAPTGAGAIRDWLGVRGPSPYAATLVGAVQRGPLDLARTFGARLALA